MGKQNQTMMMAGSMVSNQKYQKDFVYKILTVQDVKMRIQLWDVVGPQDPSTALQPIFFR